MAEMKGKRATLGDIAKHIGVSRSTVSLALNGKGTLPQSRRDEIKRVAAEFNYFPNPVAQALRVGRTRFIGVVINYFSNIYFRDFYIGLEEVADAEGFTFMVSQTYEDIEKERRHVRRFMEHGADGLIVLPCTREAEHLAQAEACGIPVVLISNTLGTRFTAVVADNAMGADLATRHLAALDTRPLVHIAGPQDQSCLRERRDTFCRVLAELRPGADAAASVFVTAGLRSSEGYRIMEQVMRRYAPPLSLFVCNDETAMGVISYCGEHGLELPRDVAIACFSGDTTFSALRLPVCTVAVHAKRMGEITARTLLDIMEHPEQSQPPPIITLPVSLHANT